jgi:UDP-3-O-[3-hydroxymyristoyl] glucosamine N-acyltransferase
VAVKATPRAAQTVPFSRWLGELAGLVGAKVENDRKLLIRGVAALEDAGPDQIAFFHNTKYRKAFAATRAGAVVVQPKDAQLADRPKKAILLVSDNPYLAFGKLSRLFNEPPAARPGRHPTAVIEPSAKVHPEAQIGPLTYVGNGASIGARTILHPGAIVEAEARVGDDCLLYPCTVVREGCVLGNRVILQPGAIVGSDGFGFAFDPEGPAHTKVPQVGIVRVEDDVEIGAGSCIDRATLGETVIGRGTKIDNLVQVAHNVQLGAHCLVCAQAGISGSSKLGTGVVLAGQVGVVGHLEIGDGARIGAGSGVAHDVPAGETQSGSPAIPHAAWLHSVAAFPRLPELLKEQRALRQRVEKLEKLLAERG